MDRTPTAATTSCWSRTPTTAKSGYSVRKVTLDPKTGAPDMGPDRCPTATFPLAISAAALHSAGWIVAVNTDNGLDRHPPCCPVATPRPPIAARHSAGPGTQVGLLSSPVAVAVTNGGTVLILEGATSSIAAFDGHGGPAPLLHRGRHHCSPAARSSTPAPSTQAEGAATGSSCPTTAATSISPSTAPTRCTCSTTPATAPRRRRLPRRRLRPHGGTLVNANSSGVNVSHLAVDHWRSIYAPNFDALADTLTGKTHIDLALGVAEPSLSRFDPNTPKTPPAQFHRTPKVPRRRR